MPDITSGKILVASYQGVYLIKMLGDVRLTLCVPFDNFIQNLLIKDDFYSIVFDFSQTEGLDSTTLGLVAKLALKSQEAKSIKTSIVGADEGIYRLLDVTGIIDLCEVIDDKTVLAEELPAPVALDISDDASQEEIVRKKVLEAHKVLVQLNHANKESFQDLIEVLSKE